MNDKIVRAALSAGLKWFYDTEQPEGGQISHHGTSVIAGDRRFTFVPSGGTQPCGPVIVISAVPEYVGDVHVPLGETELTDTVALIRDDLGTDVADKWNGHPASAGSIKLTRPAHPSLLDAVKRYGAHPMSGPGSENRRELCVRPEFSEVYRLEVERLRQASIEAGAEHLDTRVELGAAQSRIAALEDEVRALEDQVRALAVDRARAVVDGAWNVNRSPAEQRAALVEALAVAGLLVDVEPSPPGVSPRG